MRMGISESLATLKVPSHTDARFKIDPALGRIRISAYRIWWFLIIFVLFVIGFNVLFAWVMRFKPDPDLSDPSVSINAYRFFIAITTVVPMMFTALLVFWFLSFGREAIVFSDQQIIIRDKRVARISVKDIQGVRNVVGMSEMHFDASKGLFSKHLFETAPKGSVDILTADGPVRVLSRWKTETTQWLANAIATVLDKPLMPEWNEQKNPIRKSYPIRPVQFVRRELSLVGLLFAGLAVFAMASIGYVVYLGSVSMSWPSTEGHVQSHHYETWYSSMDKKVDAEIHYSYEVDGQTFKGERIWYGFHLKTPDIASLFEGLTDNDRVTVFYDPKQPKRSTLVTGYDRGLLVVLPMAFLFLLVGVGLLLYRPSRERVAFTRKYFPQRHKLQFWASTS